MSIRAPGQTPNVSREQRLLARQSRNVLSPITFSAGNPESVEPDQAIPMTALQLELDGEINWPNGPGTKDKNDWNLIDNFQIKVDGDDSVFDLPGWAIPFYSRITNRWANRESPTDDGGSDTQQFRLGAVLPFDVGGYVSPLDLSINQQAGIIAEWGQASDIAPDSGAGTATINNAQINLTQEQVAGYSQGKRGGPGHPYLRRIVNHQTRSVDGTGFLAPPHKMKNRRWYNQLIVVGESDNQFADNVITKLKVSIGNTTLITYSADQLKDDMFHRYQLASGELSGVYVLDLAQDGQFDQLLNVTGNNVPELEIEADDSVGTTQKVHIIEDYFIEPNVNRGGNGNGNGNG